MIGRRARDACRQRRRRGSRARIDGIVDYSFGNFQILATLTARPPSPAGVAARSPEAAVAPDEITVATFNVENLDRNEPDAEVPRGSPLIVEQPRGHPT